MSPGENCQYTLATWRYMWLWNLFTIVFLLLSACQHRMTVRKKGKIREWRVVIASSGQERLNTVWGFMGSSQRGLEDGMGFASRPFPWETFPQFWVSNTGPELELKTRPVKSSSGDLWTKIRNSFTRRVLSVTMWMCNSYISLCTSVIKVLLPWN